MSTSDAAAEIASTIQSASLLRHPDPSRDINPSTTASQKEPVTLTVSPPAASEVAEDEIPLSALRPAPRQRPALPPLPDLRFEQSYLKSIEGAAGWMGVLGITLRDQVILPLAQGLLWTLLLAGWKHWNAASRFSGASVGARVRRWWWGVNGWPLPESSSSASNSSAHRGRISGQSRNGSQQGVASEMSEFYQARFANAGPG